MEKTNASKSEIDVLVKLYFDAAYEVMPTNKLEKIIIGHLTGQVGVNYLAKFKILFEEEFWEVEGLCLLTLRNVFELTKDFNAFEQFIGTFSLKSDKVRQSLRNLIASLVNELKTSRQHYWKEYAKMCWLLIKMINKSGNVIVENGDEIFEYITTVVEEVEDENAVWLTVSILSEYETIKVKSWLMKRMDWLMTQLGGKVTDWKGHRNICELIWGMLRFVDGDYGDRQKAYYSNYLDLQLCDLILQYLMKLINSDEIDRAKVKAILNLELMCMTNRVDRDSEVILRNKLRIVAEKVESEALMLNQHFNSDEHQVGWCARWFVNNLWDEDGRIDQFPLIKLSSDRFEARNDTLYLAPVRSSFGVTTGVYYYEVVLVTQGNIQIGWSTRDATFGFGGGLYKVGDNEHSIAFNVYSCKIVHNNISYSIANLPSPQTPNVVGCLIDANKRQFVFYLNGHKINCQIDAHFSSSPYYATASPYMHQQCRFNFGLEKFRYSPQEIDFKNFSEVTNGDVRKYHLVDTENNNDVKWFKHKAVDNQVKLVYSDLIQQKHDDFVKLHENNIVNNQTNKIDFSRVECNRFVQSVIEVLQTELNNDEYIREIITIQLNMCTNSVFQLYSFTSKIFELIYPYTQLQPNLQNSTKCHNLGIILISILNTFPNIPALIYQMSLNFLLSTKLISIETLKRNAQLVTRALYGFDAFQINERIKRMLLKNPIFILSLKDIEKYGQLESISSLYNSSCDLQALQAGLCAKWFHDQVVSSASESQVRRATLNPTDRSALLKLSLDRLSARSDCHWQSVRSIDHVPSDLYYFEVILLTDGPMRIGWATRRTELNKAQIGKNHLSISFDGFARAVRHQGEVHQQPDIAPWKTGDVIGCLIDKSNGQFAFSLNGQPLSLPHDLKFSSLPYHAAVSLSPHQQVYFNFGQVPFKYGPQQIDYCDFHLALFYRVNTHAIDFGNAQLSQNVISINSNVTTGDISIKRKSFYFQESNENTKLNTVPSTKFQLDSIDSPNPYYSPNSPSISNLIECRLCTEPSTTKLLRFVCCPNLILCLECVKLNLHHCLLCSKQSSNSKS